MANYTHEGDSPRQAAAPLPISPGTAGRGHSLVAWKRRYRSRTRKRGLSCHPNPPLLPWPHTRRQGRCGPAGTRLCQETPGA